MKSLFIIFTMLVLGTFRIAGAADVTAPKVDDPHLLLWLDASDADTLTTDVDGHVSAWKNKVKSSDGKFESQDRQRPLFVEKAIGGRPTLRFDGVDDVLRNEHFGRSAKTWSLIVVATPRSNKGNGQFPRHFFPRIGVRPMIS